MSEAENRAAPSSKWNMAILVAVLCGAAGFCIGLLLQTQIVDLLHNASHAPDSLLSAGKTLLLMFGVLSVAISLYASIPAAIAVGLLFKFRLGRWYHFVGAGLLTMFVSLLFPAIFFGTYALIFFAITAGGMVAAAVAGSLGAWAYLKHKGQLPDNPGTEKPLARSLSD